MSEDVILSSYEPQVRKICSSDRNKVYPGMRVRFSEPYFKNKLLKINEVYTVTECMIYDEQITFIIYGIPGTFDSKLFTFAENNYFVEINTLDKIKYKFKQWWEGKR